ncbi:MAG TPA: hypothetical protein VGM23_11865, partial [Armatimonadota bacterium]
AKTERLLTSGTVVFTPTKPYPMYLDYYDLRAIKCGTLGLHPENKYRYGERSAFMKKFFVGGYFNGGQGFFERTTAEDVNPAISVLDTDIRLAEKDHLMYSPSFSTGAWPQWAQNKWPGFVDQQNPLHLFNTPAYSPESLGMTAAQRRDTSLHYLRDVMSRYTTSPVLGAWELYCGDYSCETYFWTGYQGQLGYTAVGIDAFRRWLRGVRGYRLADLGTRWYGDAGHFKSWSEVPLPAPDEFYGNYNAGCYSISEAWSWKKADAGQVELPAETTPGWTPVPVLPSMQMLTLPRGAAFWRNAFDPTAWLRQHAGQDVYLVCNVDNGGKATGVWLNGKKLGDYQSISYPAVGPFSIKLTGLLHPGMNGLAFNINGGSGCILGPIFLTTTEPNAYPYLGEHGNARYVDMLEWRIAAFHSKIYETMAYARSIDPDRPLIICATSGSVKDGQGDALRQYGGSMQDTGYEASYRPHNSRFGYVGGFYGSCEQSGIGGDMRDPAAFSTTLTRRYGWLLLNGEGTYKELRDPYCFYELEKATGWFTKFQRRYQLIGKYLPEQPKIALLYSSQNGLFGSELHIGDWDLGRGELMSSHFDNVYATETMLAQGLADSYPVLIDMDNMIMGPETINALRKYVEGGGTFIATQNSGRHTLLAPDSWLISGLTGFKVLSVGAKGTIRFENHLPIFTGWEGKEFDGEGSTLNWMSAQSAKDVCVRLAPLAADAIPLARWSDGSVAVGMRKVGKGRVIILGSTFWRNANDLGGRGMWRYAGVEPAFLERLLTDLDVQRTTNASSPTIYTRKVTTKNGLQEWLVSMNTVGEDATADLALAVEGKPSVVWDMTEQTPVPFTYADGWVHLKDMAFTAYGTRAFGVQRGTLAAGLDVWWGEKTKFWIRRAEVAPLANTPAATATNPAVIRCDTWKFYPDKDGTVSKTTDWAQPGFAAGAWRTSDNEPWNIQFDDLKDYGGIGLYRSAPFALPAGWKSQRITLNADRPAYTSTACEIYLNGEKIPEFFLPRRKIDVTERLRATGNVVCIKLTGRDPSGDYPVSGLIGCEVWVQPQLKLTSTMSLLGPWQAVHGDQVTSEMVTVQGADYTLTDGARLKPGVTPILANHLAREVEIPASWRGKQVYLHLVSPQMNGVRPPVVQPTGLNQGMVLVNGQVKLCNTAPNVPQDDMLNLTPFLKYGQKNRIELWTRNARSGSMADENIVINDVEIGCAAE